MRAMLSTLTGPILSCNPSTTVLNLCTHKKAGSASLAPYLKAEKLQDGNLTGNLNRADIDGWEVRKGMADLCAMDLVPEPM